MPIWILKTGLSSRPFFKGSTITGREFSINANFGSHASLLLMQILLTRVFPTPKIHINGEFPVIVYCLWKITGLEHVTFKTHHFSTHNNKKTPSLIIIHILIDYTESLHLQKKYNQFGRKSNQFFVTYWEQNVLTFPKKNPPRNVHYLDRKTLSKWSLKSPV